MAGGRIRNTVENRFTSSGADKVVKDTQRIGKEQTRLAQSSASAGRSFSAQANGLGGVVGVYAAAAANVFALTAAFTALNRAAQFETIVRGTNALAQSVGSTGPAVIRGLKEITNGQLSIVEAATQANLALSSGFNTDQIERLGAVSLKASKALGRNLTDAFQRITRGAIKLEPELLDEIGIFTRIEPAVEAYAASLNKSVTSLTNFERRQAFVTQVIKDGERAFADIDTSVLSTQEAFEKLVASFQDIAIQAGKIVADALAPLARFLGENVGNQIVLLGAVAGLVFGKLREVITSFATEGIGRLSSSLSGLADNFAKSGAEAGKFTAQTQVALDKFKGAGALPGAGRAFGADLKRNLASGGLTTQQALTAQKEIPNLLQNELNTRKAISDDIEKNNISREKGNDLISKSNQRTKALEATQRLVGAQLDSSSKSAKLLAGGLNLAAGAARGLATVLSAAFGVLNAVLVGFAAIQLVGSLFDADLLGYIRDLYKDLTKESRFLQTGTESLSAAFGKLDEQLTIIENKGNATAEAFSDRVAAAFEKAADRSKSALTTELNRLENQLKQIERGNFLAFKSFTALFSDDALKKDIKELKEEIEVLKLATTEDVQANKGLPKALGQLQEISEIDLGKAGGLGIIAIDQQAQQLNFSLGESTFALELFDNGLVNANDDIIKAASGFADASTRLVDLNKKLAEGTISAEKASQQLNVLRETLQKARSVFVDAGLAEAVTAIDESLAGVVITAADAVSRFVELDQLGKRLSKLFSGDFTFIDDALLKGVVSTGGEYARTQEEALAFQSRLNLEIVKQDQELQKAIASGVILGDLSSEQLAIQDNANKIRKAAEAQLVKEIMRTTELLKKQEAQVAALQSQLNIKEKQNELTRVQNEIAKETARIEAIAARDKVDLDLIEKQISLTEKLNDIESSRLNFQKELNSLIAEGNRLREDGIDIQSAIADAEGTRVAGARSRQADQTLAVAEMRGIASERELVMLRLNVAEVNYKNELDALKRREAALRRENQRELNAIQQRRDDLREQFRIDTENRRAEMDILHQQRSLAQARVDAENEAERRQITLNEQRLTAAKLQEDIALLQAAARKEAADREISLFEAQVAFQKEVFENNKKILEGNFKFLDGLAEVASRLSGGPKIEVDRPDILVGSNFEGIENSIQSIKDLNFQILTSEIEAAGLAYQKTADSVEANNDSLEASIKARTEIAALDDKLRVAEIDGLTKEQDQAATLLAFKLRNLDLEEENTRNTLQLKLEELGIQRDVANQAIQIARAEAAYKLSEQARIDAALVASKEIISNYVEDGLMAMNKAFIEGNLTFKSVTQGFKDMLGNMLREIQAAVFQKTIAKPIADGVAGFLPKILGFAAGGVAHFAAGGAMKRDRVPAMLEPGEFVIRKEAARRLGMSKLQEMNAGIRPDPVAALIANLNGSKVVQRTGGGNVQRTQEYLLKNRGNIRNYEFESQRLLGIAQNMDAFASGGFDASKVKGAGDVTALIGSSNKSGGQGMSFGLSDEERRRRTPKSEQAPITATPGSLNQFGLGSRGLPTIGILSAVANAAGLGPRAPRELQDGEALQFKRVADQLESVFGVRPTRFRGNQIGDIDPITGGIFGRQGSALTNIGSAVFGTRNSQGNPVFNSFQSGAAAIGAGFAQGRFRSTPLSVAEYNSASGAARLNFNPQAYQAFGGQRAISVNQALQLNTFGGYKNQGGGYTIPSGTFSGTIRDQSVFGGDAPDRGGRVQSSGATFGGSSFNASRDFGFGGRGFAAGGFVRQMAGGGAVMSRDRVPALLEPGEFVIRKPMAKAIGGPALNQMNATGIAPNIAVNVNNSGAPKDVQVGAPKMNGDKVILDIITRDMRNNGAIRKSLRNR